jgi:hypothetical protein
LPLAQFGVTDDAAIKRYPTRAVMFNKKLLAAAVVNLG